MAGMSPHLTDAFFQANLHQGFRFLDTRGELILAFGDPFQRVQEVTENGLATVHLYGPVDLSQPIVEVKFNAVAIWVHFRAGVTRAAIRQEGSRMVSDACDVMGVAQLTRQGLRTYSIFPTDSREAAVEMLLGGLVPTAQRWQTLGAIQSAATNLQISAPPLGVNLSVVPVERAKVTTTVHVPGSPVPTTRTDDDQPPELGVMLDADIYDDRLSETADSKPHLNRAIAFLDDGLIPLVAKLLGETSDDESHVR